MQIQKPTVTTAITVKENDTQTSPASGYLLLFAKTDDKLYKKTSGGTESEIGGGAGGGADVLQVQIFS